MKTGLISLMKDFTNIVTCKKAKSFASTPLPSTSASETSTHIISTTETVPIRVANTTSHRYVHIYRIVIAIVAIVVVEATRSAAKTLCLGTDQSTSLLDVMLVARRGHRIHVRLRSYHLPATTTANAEA